MKNQIEIKIQSVVNSISLWICYVWLSRWKLRLSWWHFHCRFKIYTTHLLELHQTIKYSRSVWIFKLVDRVSKCSFGSEFYFKSDLWKYQEVIWEAKCKSIKTWAFNHRKFCPDCAVFSRDNERSLKDSWKLWISILLTKSESKDLQIWEAWFCSPCRVWTV